MPGINADCALKPEGDNINRHPQESFIRKVFDVLLKDAIFVEKSRESLVTEWMEPESLMAVLGTNSKEMPQKPAQSDDYLIEVIKNIVRYSVKTGHPHFVNQLFSG